MELFFSPLACSLATRIVVYEIGADAQNIRFAQVNTRTKRVLDGRDFYTLNPMGQVPVLKTDEGDLLTENTAVLQYVADRFPDAKLAPGAGMERARLQQWLGFIGTELHKAVFVPLLDTTASEAVKTYTREKVALRMGVLDKHLAGREFLLERFSIADAYLATVLNWGRATGVDLARWPAVHVYHQRLLKRPAVARAFAEELALYQAAQAQAK